MNQQPTSTEFSEAEEVKIQSQKKQQSSKSKFNTNFFQRVKAGLLMLGGFFIILSAGQVYTAILIFILNFIIFKELNSLKRNYEKEINIPMAKYINWYIYITVNYYSVGTLILNKFPILGFRYPNTIGFLLTYHNIICCMLAMGAFVAFVFSLKQGYLKYQFRLFGWIVMGTFLTVYQIWFSIQNTFQGMFWFVTPTILINVNDIFAYFFGNFFGKTPLIALSPKKTWQGYIGGAVSTFLFTFILIKIFESIPGFTCPMLEPTLKLFEFPQCTQPLLTKTNLGFLPFQFSQLTFHMMLIALISSLIGPFGGFFASGLKRSIKIKDFANSIPGHGGVSDRMDCQIIIGTFTYFYLHSIVRISTNTLFYWVKTMPETQKLNIYTLLGEQLRSKGILI